MLDMWNAECCGRRVHMYEVEKGTKWENNDIVNSVYMITTLL